MGVHWTWRQVKHYQPRMLLQRLEERIVLDAAVDPIVQDIPDDNIDQAQGAASGTDAPAGGDASDASAIPEPFEQVYSADLNEVLISNSLDEVQAVSDAPVEDAEDGPRVLVISSSMIGADELASAASEEILTIVYDGSNETPSTILSSIEVALDGSQAESIAFATHDLGEGKFHLVGGYTVSPGTLLGDSELQTFWEGVGGLLQADGRVDLLACDLASTEVGSLLIFQLESLTGHEVAASDDPTGNQADGGDWILETDDVDLVSTYFVWDSLEKFQGTLMSQDKLTASDSFYSDYFGYAVSISGNYAIVGAYKDSDNGPNSGSAYIFELGDSGWTELEKLTASDGYASDYFGYAVSISGNYAIVGAHGDDDNGSGSGSAYIFELGDSGWTEVAKLTASDGFASDYFGYAVSISGDYAIVGAHGDDDNGSGSGSAYIFELGDSGWTEVAKLTASDGYASDYFGYAVSTSGNYAIVGAYGDDDNGSGSGSAYIFELVDSGWTEVAKLTASDGYSSDYFGCSVSISGNYAIVGAYGDDDNGSGSGSAYVFELVDSGWTEVSKLTASDGEAGDYFGYSGSISGNYAILGAYGDDDNGYNSGSAYVFELGNSDWIEVSKLSALDGSSDDRFGYSVSISGNYAMSGAYGDDDYGSNSGSAYIHSVFAAMNQEPIADAQTVTALEDVPLSITLTGDDGDPDVNQNLTFHLASTPTFGDLYASEADAESRTNALAMEAVLVGNTLWYNSDPDNNADTSIEFYVTDDGGTSNGGADTSSPAMVTIRVDPVNDAPVVTLPVVEQIHYKHQTLVFSSADENQIFVSDVDADEGTGVLEVTLTVDRGTLSLSGTSGLSFSTGDGVDDSTMTFTGQASDINAALNGLEFDVPKKVRGLAVLTIAVDDQANTGGDALHDTKSIDIWCTNKMKKKEPKDPKHK